MLGINYRESDLRAEIRWSAADERTPWLEIVRRLLLDHSDAAAQEDGFQIALPWWSFVALRPQLFEIFRGYELTPGRDISIGTEAATLLRQSKRNAGSYAQAQHTHGIDENIIRTRLCELGFQRKLSPEQTRNVSKIAALPASATFSVPGAGKTTVALACFFYRASVDDRLLVVAPKNAFAAWDEQLIDCMPHMTVAFTRLRGGKR